MEESLDEKMQRQLALKEKFSFPAPNLIAAKWDYLEEIDKCLRENLQDNSPSHKIYVLKYISHMYFEFHQKAQASDVETKQICQFLMDQIDIRISNLLDFQKTENSKAIKVSREKSNKSVISSKSKNTKERYKLYVDTYNHFTMIEKLDHIEAERKTCDQYKISWKTLERAINEP